LFFVCHVILRYSGRTMRALTILTYLEGKCKLYFFVFGRIDLLLLFYGVLLPKRCIFS
jgi:hypothetical protein